MTASPETWLRGRLGRAGINVWGVLDRERYDALVPAPFRAGAEVPGAGAALVLGSGGRALFAAFERSPEARRSRDPLDAYTERVVEAAAEGLRQRGFATAARYAHAPRAGRFADFVALGRASGLGWPSRLGLLIHPRFGPWLSLRAVLVTAAPLAVTSPLAGEGPCPGCAAPCARACPAAAPGPERFDVARCAATRRRDAGCQRHCAARRACSAAPEQAYTARAEAHHMEASQAWIRRAGHA